jgi:hypothetical protein
MFTEYNAKQHKVLLDGISFSIKGRRVEKYSVHHKKISIVNPIIRLLS